MYALDLNGNLTAIVTLIGAVTAGIVSIVTAIINGKQNTKLTTIQGQTNGNLISLQRELAAEKAKSEQLQAFIDSHIGNRRKQTRRNRRV